MNATSKDGSRGAFRNSRSFERASRRAAAAVRADVRYFEVGVADAGRRLDNCLLTRFKGIPRSHIYRVVRSGQVRINGGRASPSRRLGRGDVIRVPPLVAVVPAPRRVDERAAQRFKRNVLFEDRNFLVLNKPGGVVVHGGSRHHFGLAEISRCLHGGERFPALVHRLDRGTSGCLLFAKSPRVLREAQRAFRERGVDKVYTTLVCGAWDEAAVRVGLPLAVRARMRGAGPKVVVDEAAGKPALTDFHVIGRFDGCTLLRAVPHTGRMHQIRVHAAACGHPVAGDRRYGDFAANRRFARLGLKRLFLHAGELSLKCAGVRYDFKAPLPEELSAVLQALPVVADD